MSASLRLGVYADLVYARREGRLHADMAFASYLTALAERVDALTIFGREASGADAERCTHELAGDFEFVGLPYYASVADLVGVHRSLPAASDVFSQRLDALDAVWIFGPHPVSLRFASIASQRRLPIALGVRQDQPTYMRSRLTGVKRLLGVPYFDRLERRWRALGREHPVFTAGDELAAAYGGPPLAESTAFTLVREDAIASEPVATARGAALGSPVRMLSVGRLDPEKNPLLLPAIVGELAGTDRDWELTIVGDGPLESAVRETANELGVTERIEFAGYVPHGQGLERIYQQSDIFLHVSHTEGLPQVLIEAMAAGLPIVATDVGGVAAAVEAAGVPLVPPDDASAAAAALIAIAADDQVRKDIAMRGLARAKELTIEAQQSRVVQRFKELTK